MKIQDILFIILFAILFLKYKKNSFVLSGLMCLLLAIPFFYFWVFFTAERLVYYAALLVLVEVIFKFIQLGIKPRK